MKNVALVLGSGGARGIAHIGVIEELEDNGYTITSIAGSSMGAVVGAIYASGELDHYKSWMCNLDRYKVFNLMDFTLTSQGFIKGERVFNEIKKFVSARNIEDLRIPFCAVAVDISGSKEHVFSEGDLFGAIRASVAIPSVLTPVYLNDMVLIDGGVLNPLPVDKVARNENDILVAIDLNGPGDYHLEKKIEAKRQKELKREEGKWLSKLNRHFNDFFSSDEKQKKHDYFDIMNGSIDLMQTKLTNVILQKNRPDMVMHVPKNAAKTYEFFKAEELINYGRQEAKKMIAKFESKQEENGQ